MKLSKRTSLPLLLDLFYSNIIDASFFVFVKSLFISNKKEGFDSEINDVPLIVNTIVDRLVLEVEVSSKG